jgi:hypothetical protein
MSLDALRELVDRVNRETQLRSTETIQLIAATQDGTFRKSTRRSFYQDGLLECWSTVARDRS